MVERDVLDILSNICPMCSNQYLLIYDECPKCSRMLNRDEKEGREVNNATPSRR